MIMTTDEDGREEEKTLTNNYIETEPESHYAYYY
jgi:hypothetical protein